ncbi:MAG: RNA polymerase sigma factor [Planctomycetaceae bacterium]
MRHDPIDADDLDRLVREHLPAALQFAVRLTGRIESAEDIVQEALLRVARNYQTFRGDSRFRTWLFQIIINVFRDQSKRPQEEPLPPEAVPAVLDFSATSLLANELRQQIAEHVSRLPPRQREVLVLTVYEGLSVAETARVLEMSTQNVHATLHMARSRLRVELSHLLIEKS